MHGLVKAGLLFAPLFASAFDFKKDPIPSDIDVHVSTGKNGDSILRFSAGTASDPAHAQISVLATNASPDDEYINFELEVLPSEKACGYGNVLVNGELLPQESKDGISSGKGLVATNLDESLTASWAFECLTRESEETAQLLKFNVNDIAGKPVENVGFALSFKQTGKPEIIRIQSGSSEETTNWFDNGRDEHDDLQDGEHPEFDFDAEVEEIQSLRAEVDHLMHIIHEKERALEQHKFDLGHKIEDDIKKCDSLKCIVRLTLDKARGAAHVVYGKISGDFFEEFEDGGPPHFPGGPPPPPHFPGRKHHPKQSHREPKHGNSTHGPPPRFGRPHGPPPPHFGDGDDFAPPPPHHRPHPPPPFGDDDDFYPPPPHHHRPPPPPFGDEDDFFPPPPPHHRPPPPPNHGDEFAPPPPHRQPNDKQRPQKPDHKGPAPPKDHFPGEELESKPVDDIPPPPPPPPGPGPEGHDARPPPPPEHRPPPPPPRGPGGPGGPGGPRGPHRLHRFLHILKWLVLGSILALFLLTLQRRHMSNARRANRRPNFISRFFAARFGLTGADYDTDEKAGLLNNNEDDDEGDMDGEINQLRNAASVVGDIVAAEEGRFVSSSSSSPSQSIPLPAPLSHHEAFSRMEDLPGYRPGMMNMNMTGIEGDGDEIELPRYEDNDGSEDASVIQDGFRYGGPGSMYTPSSGGSETGSLNEVLGVGKN